MARGIIYAMTTVVQGLVKIGKTGTDNFEQRMRYLEQNGYANISGLKRHFAIEVDDYDEKEKMLDYIFSKSRVDNTELFALDIELVVQLLSSMTGKQIYPKEITKEASFREASDIRSASLIPDGIYTLTSRLKDGTIIKASMKTDNGLFTVLSGSDCAPDNPIYLKLRKNAIINNGKLQEDMTYKSPSLAAALILCCNTNGWLKWKNSDGEYIDIYRQHKNKPES